MSAIMKISSQGQVRIPKKFMSTLGVETGDYVEMVIENGAISLKPRKLIDPAQGWYWTKEWQENESDASRNIEMNEISPEFETVEQGIQWLKK